MSEAELAANLLGCEIHSHFEHRAQVGLCRGILFLPFPPVVPFGSAVESRSHYGPRVVHVDASPVADVMSMKTLGSELCLGNRVKLADNVTRRI